MQITVNDIGDGLFMELFRNDHLLITDFGSQQAISSHQLSYFTNRLQQYRQNDFALSHFHKDHYSGLVALESQKTIVKINTVLLPKLPQDPPVINLFFALQALNHFSLGSSSGSLDFDFLSLVGRLNQGGYMFRPLSQGDNFSVDGKSFTVSWPPPHLTSDTLAKVSQAVKDFRTEVTKIPPLEDLYNEIGQHRSIPIYLEGGSQEIYIEQNNNQSSNRKVIKPQLTRQQRAVLGRINRKLKGAANRLSLCYFNEEINFMGDLEANEIGQCIKFIRAQPKDLKWKFIVLPHHGTHWHPDMHNLNGLIGVSSNGNKMIKHWKAGNKHICSVNILTHVDGGFSYTL